MTEGHQNKKKKWPLQCSVDNSLFSNTNIVNFLKMQCDIIFITPDKDMRSNDSTNHSQLDSFIINYDDEPISITKFFKNIKVLSINDMKRLVGDSPVNFYFFCWRGAENDPDPNNKLIFNIHDFYEPHIIRTTVKYLHDKFDLMEEPRHFHRITHQGDDKIDRYTYNLTDKGTDLYYELQVSGLINKFKELINEDKRAFQSPNDFRDWFNFVFYFGERKENYYLHREINELRKEIKKPLPNEGLRIYDNQDENNFTVKYIKSGGLTSLTIEKLKIEITCYECKNVISTDYTIKRLKEILRTYKNVLEIQHIHENIIRTFTIDYFFTKFTYKDKKLFIPKILDPRNINLYKPPNILEQSKAPLTIELKELLYPLDKHFMPYNEYFSELETIKSVLEDKNCYPTKRKRALATEIFKRRIYMILKKREEQGLIKIQNKDKQISIKLTKKGLKKKLSYKY